MTISKITVAGGGVMGSQVAWQAATHGLDVIVYDAFEKGIARCSAFLDSYAKQFTAEKRLDPKQVAAARSRLMTTTDLSTAVSTASVVIEQVPEDIEIKQSFWKEASALAPADAVLLTNTSSLLPSDIASSVQDPSRFLALHFCVPVWDANIGEIMAQSKTDPAHLEVVKGLAEQMGLVPIMVKKEQPGYVLNTILIPFMVAGLGLVKNGVADAETIDTVWHICNQSKIGPLQMTNMVGMGVAEHIARAAGKDDPNTLAIADWLKKDYIDKGHLGMQSGEGFYRYAG